MDTRYIYCDHIVAHDFASGAYDGQTFYEWPGVHAHIQHQWDFVGSGWQLPT